MQSLGEADPDTCAFNDLALVRIDPADVGKVNPSIPFWGGPTGVDPDGTVAGDKVLSFGNSELRGGVTALSPKEGASLGDDGGGWSHTGLHRDAGDPGRLGQRVPQPHGPGARRAVDRRDRAARGQQRRRRHRPRAAYLTSNTSFAVTLANGTEPFRGPLLPV